MTEYEYVRKEVDPDETFDIPDNAEDVSVEKQVERNSKFKTRFNEYLEIEYIIPVDE